MTLRKSLELFFSGVINSYSQIFFSNNKWFALLLIITSFIDPYAGLGGIVAVVVSNLFAYYIGLSPDNIRNGVYGFNSAMIGMVLGVYFKLSAESILILCMASLFSLLLTAAFLAWASKYGVPFMSFPFLICIWTVLLTTRTYSSLELSERGIYTINELWFLGGENLVGFYNFLNDPPIPQYMDVYLKSLGAIFFQYNLIAGVLIFVGMLIFSRISLVLSIVGFATGYTYYKITGADFTQLQYSYIGFNFILSAIALGGFFLIPSPRSFLAVLLSIPLIALLIGACAYVLGMYQLPTYSLPFNIIVMLVLYVLQLRYVNYGPYLVQEQFFSPEKNLYSFLYRKERYYNQTYYHIHLPFFGEWKVSQGHSGNITHKGDWKEAWDFVVTDEQDKTWRSPGTNVTDFYCYNLPVLSPQAGYVIKIEDTIDDNTIGGVDLEHNWGNTIIIKHGEDLYSKLNHIKKGSFKVKEGDYVYKGDVLATCGNSGRSPEPHIHFQLQVTPFIASKTIKYPISYYVSKKNSGYDFHSFDYPKEGETISRVVGTKLLKDAFYFIPGKSISWDFEGQNFEWKIFTNAYNQAYIYCRKTNSVAYFVNNDTLHYFTEFYGDKKSLLYYFYLGAHKILLGYYQNLEVNDLLPVEGFYSGPAKFFQDFIAPFYIFLKTKYVSRFVSVDDINHPQQIKLSSVAEVSAYGMENRKIEFELVFSVNKISSFTITEKGKKREAVCV